MIRKSGGRSSEKMMLQQKGEQEKKSVRTENAIQQTMQRHSRVKEKL
jgi:hypothetical protein